MAAGTRDPGGVTFHSSMFMCVVMEGLASNSAEITCIVSSQYLVGVLSVCLRRARSFSICSVRLVPFLPRDLMSSASFWSTTSSVSSSSSLLFWLSNFFDLIASARAFFSASV